MNFGYNIKTYSVGDVVVVPLATPDGIYIKINQSKIPVLAKIRSIFSETANVINFFGYVYNVPLKHIEALNGSDVQFYTAMLEKAKGVLLQLGYDVQDNADFFHDTRNQNFVINLIGFDSKPALLYSPAPNSPNQNIIISSSPPPKDKFIRSDEKGLVKLSVIDNSFVIHEIVSTKHYIIFDESSGQLLVRGYGKFLVDGKVRFSDMKYNDIVIFRSKRQYIVVMYRDIQSTLIPSGFISDGFFRIEYTKLDKKSEILKIIRKKFY